MTEDVGHEKKLIREKIEELLQSEDQLLQDLLEKYMKKQNNQIENPEEKLFINEIVDPLDKINDSDGNQLPDESEEVKEEGDSSIPIYDSDEDKYEYEEVEVKNKHGIALKRKMKLKEPLKRSPYFMRNGRKKN